MSIRFKLMSLIASLFITALGNSIFTFKLESYGEEKLAWVNHTHLVLHHSELFLSSLKDAETGQRGFLLTQKPPYLQPYHAGIASSKKHFKKLKELTLDNPKQQQRLLLIQELMTLKFDELAQTIKLTQDNRDNTEAIALVNENQGKQHMDNLRNTLDEFNNEEALLLEQRKGDFKASRAMITTLILVELMLFTFLAFFTFSFLQKNIFQPLDLLLSCTKKAEQGKPIDITDITKKDEMGYLIASFFTMSEKIYQRTNELNFKAHHDELTGLNNRTNIFNDIENAMVHSKDNKTKLAIFFIDLDGFKTLNDTLGHDAGDVVLKETATRLQNTIRSNDSVYRVGGDEFVILIKDLNTATEVRHVVSNIFNAIKLPVLIQQQPKGIALSLGVAIFPDDTDNAQELVKYSDIAMYAAKRDSDCDYKFFDPSMLKRASDTL